MNLFPNDCSLPRVYDICRISQGLNEPVELYHLLTSHKTHVSCVVFTLQVLLNQTTLCAQPFIAGWTKTLIYMPVLHTN